MWGSRSTDNIRCDSLSSIDCTAGGGGVSFLPLPCLGLWRKSVCFCGKKAARILHALWRKKLIKMFKGKKKKAKEKSPPLRGVCSQVVQMHTVNCGCSWSCSPMSCPCGCSCYQDWTRIPHFTEQMLWWFCSVVWSLLLKSSFFCFPHCCSSLISSPTEM